jgi:hypothetical protein
MAQPNKHRRITETPDSVMLERYWDKFYRPQRSRIGPLAADVECVWAFIQLTADTGEEDRVALEAAIVGLPGIEACEMCIGGVVPSANSVPANHEMYATIEGRFVSRPVRQEPEE